MKTTTVVAVTTIVLCHSVPRRCHGRGLYAPCVAIAVTRAVQVACHSSNSANNKAFTDANLCSICMYIFTLDYVGIKIWNTSDRVVETRSSQMQ